MVRSEQKYEIRNTRYEIRNDVEMCGTADVRPSAYVGILDDHFYIYTLRQAQCRAFIFCLERMSRFQRDKFQCGACGDVALRECENTRDVGMR